MPRLTRFAALIASSLLAGCAVGPDYLPPDPPMPGAYMGAGAVGQHQTPRHAADAALVDWWQAFDDPQLTDFVDRALQRNLDLAQAFARVRQARAGLDSAGAALLPSGNVTAQGARSRQSVETPLGQILNTLPGFDRYGSAYEVNLGVGWELDLFGGLARSRQAAQARYQATQAAAVAVRLAVAAQTADTFIQMRGLQARLDVARAQVGTQRQLRATVELLWQQGLASELQLRQAEGALARAQAPVPLLEAALETAMNAMDVMLGETPGTHRAALTQTRPIPALTRMAPGGTPGDLLRRRPDIIVAERQLAESNARIGVAMAEYYPKVSISGLIGSATALSSANLLGNGAAQAGAVAGLRWRLFDFGRINAEIDLAQAQQAQALAAYRQAVLRATQDVENALLSSDRVREQAAVLGQGVASLARARDASAAAYDQGVVSRIEVLQAEESLLNLRDAQLQARADAARSAVALFKALGGGWMPEPAGLRHAADTPS